MHLVLESLAMCGEERMASWTHKHKVLQMWLPFWAWASTGLRGLLAKISGLGVLGTKVAGLAYQRLSQSRQRTRKQVCWSPCYINTPIIPMIPFGLISIFPALWRKKCSICLGAMSALVSMVDYSLWESLDRSKVFVGERWGFPKMGVPPVLIHLQMDCPL